MFGFQGERKKEKSLGKAGGNTRWKGVKNRKQGKGPERRIRDKATEGGGHQRGKVLNAKSESKEGGVSKTR